MISFVKGTLVEVLDGVIVLECNGMGYNINFPTSSLGALPGMSNEVKIYTYMCVREDSISLYGFLERGDVELFKKLITVSGIGPKGAMGIIGFMGSDELRFAILAGDAKSIAKSPGIGAKTAQKLILELKDKMEINTAEGTVSLSSKTGNTLENDAVSDALLVLEQFGFSSTDSMKAIRLVEGRENMDSGMIVKKALAYLGGL